MKPLLKHSLAGALLAVTVFATVGCAVADDTPPTARIAQYSGDRAAAISYTFDDGLRDQYTVAIPILNEVGFKGTFFVIPSATPETTEEAEKNAAKKRAWGGITWSELKEMAAHGHEIGSHTWSHPNLGPLSPEDVDAQFRKAYDVIKTQIGQAPLTVAFPFNASTPEVKAAALKYHVGYRAYQTATSGKSTADSLNAWADKLVKDKGWGVIMAHAIGSGYAALPNPEILRTHLKYVKGRESDIWVDTFSNITRYQKEREDAKLSVTGTAGNVTCVLGGTLDSQIYNVPLTIVIDGADAKSASAKRAGQDLPVSLENGSIYVQASPNVQPIALKWK